MASRAPIPGMSSAIPRWPTLTPTCDAIHGMRAAKLPVTHPCTANTAAVPRRALRTSGAGAARSGADVAAAVTVRDYPAPSHRMCPRAGRRRDSCCDHVAAVYRLLPSKHRLALLWLEWSGARVSSIDTTTIGDYDEPRRRVRLRAAASKTRRALWVDLPDVLAEALERTLPPRGDRNPEARLFAASGADAIRTSIAKACRAAGVPLWSPHDLRHRRISLLHRQGRTWAEIGALVGQRSLKVTSDTYTHVLVDSRELDYAALLT